MTIRRLGPGTQHQYIRHVKSFADFVGRSSDKVTPEDVRRYQLRLASMGTTVPTLNAGASALRFFFRVTLKRRDLADAVVSVREPRRAGGRSRFRAQNARHLCPGKARLAQEDTQLKCIRRMAGVVLALQSAKFVKRY
jgi:hypothetical protein